MIIALDNDVDILADTYLENFNNNLKVVWAKAKENIDKKKLEMIARDNAIVRRRLV